MGEWPALARWTPAYFKDRHGDHEIEVYYWGQTGLDWEARTRIESMSLRRFVDEVLASPEPASPEPASPADEAHPALSRSRQMGYLQESSFLEDDDDDSAAAGSLWSADELAAAPLSPLVRAARARASQLIPPSLMHAWADVLWFPRTPLRPMDVALLETAFWMGGAGVGTGVHYDASPAFLHQVYGKKRVVLWPPSARLELAPSTKYNYGAELSSMDARPFLGGPPLPNDSAARARMLSTHPGFATLPNATVDLFPGDTLAVPPGWWHATITLTVSISVAVRVQSKCQKRAEWLDDTLLFLHNAGLYKRHNCVCHSEAAARGTGR
ncbi:hypothetical protein T492DRAFT_931180 [Pavlovales sp. CCMP2436]|nr:hypothetical protein T492DRAFT_931180 [Pavlovales sp. CCMP2436]